MTTTNIAFDPASMQNYMLKTLEGKEIEILDPTTPAGSIIEVFSSTTTDALQEMSTMIRNHTPLLALTYNEVYRHLDSETLLGAFAIPAVTLLRFYISRESIIQQGVTKDGNTTITIPRHTEIKVNDIYFTTLEDIHITMFGTREHIEADFDIFGNSKGVIPSKQVTDANGVRWIIFDLEIEQVKRTLTYGVVTGQYETEVEIENEYSYSKVYLEVDGEEVEIDTTFSDSVYDTSKPTIHVSVEGNKVIYKTPNIYVGESVLTGKLRIETYSCMGKIVAGLNKVDITNFKITLGDTRSLDTALSISNAHLMVNSPFVLDGGVNRPTLEELKRKIVEDTLGRVASPVTFNELKEKAARFSFKLSLHEDIITGRIFRASKSLPTSTIKLPTRMDMFSNTVHMINKDLELTRVKEIHNTTVIPSNTMFKTMAGVTTVISREEETNLLSLTEVEMKARLKSTRYFNTPFYYMLASTETTTDARAYDLDLPEVDDLTILSKNSYSLISVNISDTLITKIEKGYSIITKIIYNDFLKSIPKHDIMIECILGKNKNITIQSALRDDDTFETIIETNNYVNDKDEIEIYNVVSSLTSNLIPLSDTVEFIIYVKDASAVIDAYSLTNDLTYTGRKQALTKQRLNYTLGSRLDYIWSKVDVSYTENKYLRHQFDKIMQYKEDVYEVFSNGSIYKTINNNGRLELYSNILHYKGENILDEDGNVIYEYRKNTVVYDDKNKPIIDIKNGLLRYVDILMLEAQYFLVKEDLYNDSLAIAKNTLRRWLKLDLSLLNEDTLEQTKILYKPNKSIKNVNLMINGGVKTIRETLIPIVKLYVESDGLGGSFTNQEVISIIGSNLTSFLEGEVNDVPSLKNNILKDLDYLATAVAIDLKTTDEEVINLELVTSKLDGSFSLDKTIERKEVVYNIELDIINIDNS